MTRIKFYRQVLNWYTFEVLLTSLSHELDAEEPSDGNYENWLSRSSFLNIKLYIKSKVDC